VKLKTPTSITKSILDDNFEKKIVQIHPTIIPFLTAMQTSKPCPLTWIEVQLQPFVAAIYHNRLTPAKTYNIVHTLMGNFCHGDEDKASQLEEMGNDAIMFIGYHDKV
jgi:hypothetical protein